MNDKQFQQLLNDLRLLDAQQAEDMFRFLGNDYIKSKTMLSNMDAQNIGTLLIVVASLLRNRSGN
jgi:hypothetical protein